MGRREHREEMQATWMVMREPRDIDGNRQTRRARVVEMRRKLRAERKAGALRTGDRVMHEVDRGLGTVLRRNEDGSYRVKWDDPESDVTSFPPRLLLRVNDALVPVSKSAAEMPGPSLPTSGDEAGSSAADSEVA